MAYSRIRFEIQNSATMTLVQTNELTRTERRPDDVGDVGDFRHGVCRNCDSQFLHNLSPFSPFGALLVSSSQVGENKSFPSFDSKLL